MKTSLSIAFSIALNALLFGSAIAQEAPPEAQSVDIVGIRNPQVIPYALMRSGEEAFRTHHSLAPTASLRFLLAYIEKTVPQSERSSMELTTPPGGFDLRLRSGDQSVRIPVENMHFVLPDSSEVNLEKPELVVVNRPHGSVDWGAVVRSPNLPLNTMRLGDLRLECEVNWPTYVDEASFMTRIAMKVAGASCRSKKLKIPYPVGTSVTSITLVAGERRVPLQISASRTFIPPLQDSSWPDDTLITFTLGTPEKPL